MVTQGQRDKSSSPAARSQRRRTRPHCTSTTTSSGTSSSNVTAVFPVAIAYGSLERSAIRSATRGSPTSARASSESDGAMALIAATRLATA